MIYFKEILVKILLLRKKHLKVLTFSTDLKNLHIDTKMQVFI